MYGGRRRGNSSTLDERMTRQIQIRAARVLSNNLESNDIIDLAAAAASFYDKLTIGEGDLINMKWIGRNYSESERRRIIEHNYRVLSRRYYAEKYYDPVIPPTTIKDLLIKIYWLSFAQLPENNVDVEEYLTWESVCRWMMHIWHNGTFDSQFEDK